MSSDYETPSLTGKLLIAMPAIADTQFRGAVVLLCAHSAEGAMGLVINRPAADRAITRLRMKAGASVIEAWQPLHFGGPAEVDRPFVLHPPSYDLGDTTLRVDGGHSLTATSQAMEDVARGQVPKRRIVALGYAGWGPGQLEREMLANVWLTTPADPTITFDLPNDRKWHAAAGALGVEAHALSGAAGHA
ncbi:YqgE/AlgH family protein [Jannaschia sp. LMIT008]|uniref:YqgE/AlgH family protein n=1 Tax=Jannaschia maritima TaxID=3032585 RepID=UPI0028116ADA|nr:YqgE/AlgH family protein [Jannaschia sp. LMIT008]